MLLFVAEVPDDEPEADTRPEVEASLHQDGRQGPEIQHHREPQGSHRDPEPAQSSPSKSKGEKDAGL